MVNYEYYKIFYFSCKYMNFTKAAAALGTSQSAISHSMQNLEYQLGCRLFSRSNRGIKLTPEGEHLLTYVSSGCEQLIKAENELMTGNNAEKGIVYLSATETALHCFLFEKLNSFNLIYPDIKFKIENSTTYAACEAVKSGQCDYSIVSTPIHISKPLKEKKLLTFSDVLICGDQFKDLSLKKMSLEKIKEYSYIGLCKGTATRFFFDSFFEKHNMYFLPDTEIATTDMMIPMVKNNMGIGFVPDIMLKNPSDDIYIINVTSTPPPRDVSIIYNTLTPKSQASKIFYNHLCNNMDTK